MKTIYAPSQGATEMAKALTAHQIMGLTETTPPGLLALAAKPYTASHIGGHVLRSTGGLQRSRTRLSVYVADAVVERLAPLGPVMLEVELNITCVSYYGFIDFGFATTPEIANDIDN